MSRKTALLKIDISKIRRFLSFFFFLRNYVFSSTGFSFKHNFSREIFERLVNAFHNKQTYTQIKHSLLNVTVYLSFSNAMSLTISCGLYLECGMLFSTGTSTGVAPSLTSESKSSSPKRTTTLENGNTNLNVLEITLRPNVKLKIHLQYGFRGKDQSKDKC